MSKEIDAVVLAGGLGSRMGELGQQCQKCLLPVEGRPILGHIFDEIQDAFGSARVIVATGHLGETVRERFGSSYRNIQIEYVHNSDRLETRRRLLLAETLLKGPFLFLAGDVIAYFPQLQKVAESFEREGCVMGVISGATFHEPALSHGLIATDANRVTELIFPPSVRWNGSQLREMHIAYFGNRFIERLRDSSQEIKYLSSVLSLAIKEGEEFRVEKYVDLWYHFVNPLDLNVRITFDGRRA